MPTLDAERLWRRVGVNERRREMLGCRKFGRDMREAGSFNPGDAIRAGDRYDDAARDEEVWSESASS